MIRHIPEEITDFHNIPTIFFSCHPKDCAYLKEIADDILSIHRCVIFYEDDYSAEYDEQKLREHLSSVQLIVFPVTGRLLSEPCRAMDFEYRAAVESESRVTVLPIITEGVSDVDFNAKFGRVHALNKFDQTLFAIPYNEQLKRFIESILADDEMVQRIQKAFDAQIFLSYRKVDINSATELMKLIHEKAIFRDVAIWYDNYLSPGEQFDERIEEAINNSLAFLVVVTQNLYKLTPEGKKNYVIDREVPAARSVFSGEQIIAVEMQKTDPDSIEIKDCILPAISKNDTDEIASILEKAICMNGISLRTKNDNEHDYLIGLAYLNGVSVEKNNAIALTAITSAAEAGYPEAMKRLSFMYRSGTGVERDYRLYKTWFGRYLEKLKEIYVSEGTFAGCKRLVSALADYAAVIAKYDENAEANSLLKYALTVCEDYIKRNNPEGKELFDLMSKKANCYLTMGEICLKDDGAESAKEHFTAAGKILSELLIKNKTIDVQRDYVRTLFFQGKAAIDRRDEKKGMEIYTEAAEYARESLKHDESFAMRLLMYDCFLEIAKVHKVAKRIKEAIAIYDEILSYMRETLNSSRVIEVLLRIANCCRELGELYIEQSKSREAIKYSTEAQELFREIMKKYETPNLTRHLAVTYFNIAQAYRILGKRNEELKNALLGFDLIKTIESKSDTVDTKVQIAMEYYNLGMVYQALGKKDEALKLLYEAYNRYTALEAVAKHIHIKTAIASILYCIGFFAAEEKKYTEASTWFNAAIAKLEPSLSDSPTAELRMKYAQMLIEISTCQGADDSPDKAEAWEFLLKGIRMYEELENDTESGEVKAGLSSALIWRAEKYLSKFVIKDAACDLDRAIEYMTPICQDSENPEWEAILGTALLCRAQIYLTQFRYKEAACDLDRAIAAMTPICQISDNPDFKRCLASATAMRKSIP